MEAHATRGSVMIAEADPELASALASQLCDQGYRPHLAGRERPTLATLRALAPDLVVLDATPLARSGIELCSRIRQATSIPVIMTSARATEDERLLGLEAGADDFICKPYSPREMAARVRTVLRRYSGAKTAITELRFDLARCTVSHRSADVKLTQLEFRMLFELARVPGYVLTREELMKTIYNRRVVSDRTIDSHIRNLRVRLRGLHTGREIVQAVYGIGYKIEATQRDACCAGAGPAGSRAA